MSTQQKKPPMDGTLKQLSTNLIGSVRRQTSRSKRVIVIVNPAAGQDRPILKTINSMMRSAEVDWNLVITHGSGDGYRLARQAVASGADLVAVYGGDGTVAEVASGLSGSAVAMGILPGGTSNFIANTFGFSRDLTQSLSLILDPSHPIYPVRVSKINRIFFIQMVGIGLEANMVDGAARENKERFGWLAYGFSALQSITNLQVAHYHMDLDGKIADCDGVTCLIINNDNLHLPAITSMAAKPKKGLLDIAILQRADMRSFLSVASTLAGGSFEVDKIPHWQARDILIETDSPQLVQSDGEIIGHTPVRIRFTNRKVRMIVSPQRAASIPEFDYLEENEEEEEPAYADSYDEIAYSEEINDGEEFSSSSADVSIDETGQTDSSEQSTSLGDFSRHIDQ